MELFFYALALQLSAIAVPFVLRRARAASALAHLLLVIGLTAGLGATLAALFAETAPRVTIGGIPETAFRFDALGLYFLAIVQLVAIPISIYSYSYLKHYIARHKSVTPLLVFYPALVVATQLTVAANHAILFLVCWELMSTAAYLGMAFEKEKRDVQTGSFYYLVMNHAVVFILYVFFFLLHRESGSWLFSDFHVAPDAGLRFFVLYALALTAFGMKAGFMPFHFWLPRAHPIAPTVFSAFLSGLIIKTGIYGIFRTFQFLNPTPEWLGWAVLAASMISAIFGVWYALAQHDLKRLLAYHSVENIGIIGIGVGIGFIGSACNSPTVQMLGFGGALLHTLNHAIFKSLLFIGSGIIYQNLGTRNIELMGGLARRGRLFALLFLIGSVAISGIPPFNGFISEFIIFNSFFSTARELKNYYPLLMLISTVGLAFVGGLAVACFTKINSIIFLGEERREIKHFRLAVYDYLALGILALLCAGIGFWPQPFIRVIDSVAASAFLADNAPPALLNINWFYLSLIFAALLLGLALICLWRLAMTRKYGHRRSAAWGCGYERLTPRMQYTASSFADQLNTIARAVLGYRKKARPTTSVFPSANQLEVHADDLVDARILMPLFDKFSAFIARLELLSYSDIRYYVAFILIIISIYSIVGFLWI